MNRNPLITLALTTTLFLIAAGCGKSAPEAPPETVAPAVETPVPEIIPPATESAPMIEEAETPSAESTPTASAASTPTETPPAEWLIVPGERVGIITAATTEADLIAEYGADNVRDEDFYLGEGETEPGTVVFPEDDTKRLMILWSDPATRHGPVAVEISGKGSVWKTADGLGIGSTLTAVEAINGKPFSLFGFEWDYGGRVSDFMGGALGTPEGALQITFQPDYDADPPFPADQMLEVVGDSEFRSDHPVMRALDPVIYSMTIGFAASPA